MWKRKARRDCNAGLFSSVERSLVINFCQIFAVTGLDQTFIVRRSTGSSSETAPLSTSEVKHCSEGFGVSQHSCSSFKLGPQVPVVSWWQGHVEGGNHVGNDEEHLHIGKLCSRTNPRANTIGQEPRLVIDEITIFSEKVLRVKLLRFLPELRAAVTSRIIAHHQCV